MAFIRLEDLQKRMPHRLLTQLIGGQPERVTDAIRAAIEEAEGYLRHRFETEVIFSREGYQRHPVLVLCVVELALYNLEGLAEIEAHTELRMTAREDAIDWLKNAGKGAIDAGPLMPLRPNASGTAPISSYVYTKTPRPKTRY